MKQLYFQVSNSKKKKIQSVLIQRKVKTSKAFLAEFHLACGDLLIVQFKAIMLK